jgi:hypothetical protein
MNCKLKFSEFKIPDSNLGRIRGGSNKSVWTKTARTYVGPTLGYCTDETNTVTGEDGKVVSECTDYVCDGKCKEDIN